jgi:hypothetical protein
VVAGVCMVLIEAKTLWDAVTAKRSERRRYEGAEAPPETDAESQMLR